MIEATMLDVSAGDGDVAMASSPYYHADAAMMDADYAEPETEEIDMDDGAAPEYEMADDDSYYQAYPQPAAPDTEIADATVDPPSQAPQDAAAHTIDMPLVAPAPEPSMHLEPHVSEASPAPVFSAEAAPAPGPVFAFSDVSPVDAFPPVPPQELPEHVSPLPLPASDLPAENLEAPSEHALPPAPAEPASFTNEAAAPVEDESLSHEAHPEHPAPYTEEAAVAPAPEPTAEAHATSGTIPGSESHAHDAPPPQDADARADEAAPAAESHVYEASAPGEVTLVEDPAAYDLYEDDFDEGSAPSDVPAPTVSMSVQNDPAAHYILFELAENASSSTTTFLFSDRPNLYYEPVSAVFEALRQIESFATKYEYCELALFAQQLNLTIAEDSKHASEVSFSDFALLHDSFGLEGPLQVQLQSITPRFIKRFIFLREEVSRMMNSNAASQVAVEPEESHAAVAPEHGEHSADNYEPDQDVPADSLEPQTEALPETDESRAEAPQPDPEATEESGYPEDDETGLEYEDIPADGAQEYQPAGHEHEDQEDDVVSEANGEAAEDGSEKSDEAADADVHEVDPASPVDELYEPPAQPEDVALPHEQPEVSERASEHSEPTAHLEQDVSEHDEVALAGDEVEDETSGEGDEDEGYSQEYAEYEGYDEDDEGEDAEVHELDGFADDTNSSQAQFLDASYLSEAAELIRSAMSGVVDPEAFAEHDDGNYPEEEVSHPQQIIDLTGEPEPITDSAEPVSHVEDVEEYAESYSAVQSSYEGGEVYDVDDNQEQEQEKEQAYGADTAEAYEEDDQATLSSSDDRVAHPLPSISSKRSHDELLRQDPEFDGDGLGEDDHDSKRARID